MTSPRRSPSTSPTGNSLLNLLNPYSSLNRSALQPRHVPEPESPSAVLLRELQGGEGGTDDALPALDADGRRSGYFGSKVSSHAAHGSSGGDVATRGKEEEEPSPSLMFGQGGSASAKLSGSDGSARSGGLGGSGGSGGSGSGGSARNTGDRTPRSNTPIARRSLIRAGPSATSAAVTSRGHSPSRGRPMSPGPFQAPSSSTSVHSRSQSRNHSPARSTSPGPSSLSASAAAYASALDATGLQSATASRDPSTSPDAPRVPAPLPSGRGLPREAATATAPSQLAQREAGYLDPPLAGSSKGKSKSKKSKTTGGRTYAALEADDVDALPGGGEEATQPRVKQGLNEYEKALWKWVNVQDLDAFLQEVYDYYKGKGLWCILLARFLNLITTFFVIGFSTFLFSCIDYSLLSHELSGPDGIGRLDDVLVGSCLTGGSIWHKLFILTVALVYIFQLASFLASIPRLGEMYRFYTHLLGVPDADVQTLPWPEIVRLIGDIRKHNPVTSLSNGQPLAELIGEEAGVVKKLDAHDIANRILRQENYLIALFNKDLLDLRVRLPVPSFLHSLVPSTWLAPSAPRLPGDHGNTPGADLADRRVFVAFGKNTLTKALEWNLRFCLLGYLFDERGMVRREFVVERRRKDLVEGLKRRLIFMGVLNALFAPFIIVYLLIYSFFRYFEEYHKNPSSIGSRGYTPYAQWKFREFNELPHLFERRLDQSYPPAKEYIDQFPKERTALVMRFVSFVAGSFAAVLLVASLLDPDLFLHFEITPHRTVLFYLGVFGGILAVSRGMIPEENLVFDPEASLREVVRWTHYLPEGWEGKLHSQAIHQEFGTLFAMKISIFFTELLSVLLTPFILWFSLPPCAGAIIDFFREFTVHVEGVGYVCSFAVFDFRRHGQTQTASAQAQMGEVRSANKDAESKSSGMDPRIGALLAGQPLPGAGKSPSAPTTSMPNRPEARNRPEDDTNNKMEKSFLHFKATHPDWQPDPSSSIFLDRLVSQHQQHLSRHPAYPGHGAEMRSPPFVGARGKRNPYGMGSVYAGTAGGGGRGLGLGGGVAGSVYGASMMNSIFGDQDLRARHRVHPAVGSIGVGAQVGGITGGLANRRSRQHMNPNGDMLSPPPALGRMEEGDDESQGSRPGDGDVDGLGVEWGAAPERGRQSRGGRDTRRGGTEDVGHGEGQNGHGHGPDERFMRDAGLVGILQQIVATGGGIGR